MTRRWQRIALAALGVAALIGLLLASVSAAASPKNKTACTHPKAGAHKQAACAPKKHKPHKKPKSPKKIAVPGVGDVNPAMWMHDLADHLQARKLKDIVIPGSHDTGTYGLPDDPISLIGKAQTEDITSQLNDGIRDLDVRVGWDGSGGIGGCQNLAYDVVHGILSACSVTLEGVFDQIEQWANQPGHEQEIILVGLTIDQHDGQFAFPTKLCQGFAAQLGSALLTPDELRRAYGTADPGQVTLGQLWSMSGHPRVILNNSQCLDAGDPNAGQWSPGLPFGSGGGQSYYANQCYAGAYNILSGDRPGIQLMVLQASLTRATQGGGDEGGHQENLGPRMVGGLWTLFVQATPSFPDCLKSLSDFLPEQEKVLAALYSYWRDVPDTKANVNIISGDFVQSSALFKDVMAMDQSLPAADSIKGIRDSASADPNGAFDDHFLAEVTYKGKPAGGVPVTYQVSPADGSNGPTFWQTSGADTLVVVSKPDGAAELPYQHALLAGPKDGTWTLTASAPGAPTPAKWTLTVIKKPPPAKVSKLVTDMPAPTVQAGANVAQFPAFRVRALDGNGGPVGNVPVTFDATSIGTFEYGIGPIYKGTSMGGGTVWVLGHFKAGTRAGTWAVSASTPGVPSLSLPITITPGPPATVTSAGGDDQHTGRGQPFPQPLAVGVSDKWGNLVTGTPVTFTVTSGDATFASATRRRTAKIGTHAVRHGADPPRHSVTVSTDDNAVATAPVVTAGATAGPIVVTASADKAASAVKPAVFHLSAAKIAPSAPTITNLGDGNGWVSVAFSGANSGTAPVTSYTVSATDRNHPTAPPGTATGPGSPIRVKGLNNGDPYVFTVTAASADGTSPPSAPTGPLNVGVPPVVVSGPSNGTVGKPYSSGFTVTGAPSPTVTLESGDVPPGLTLASDGTLTGTPTRAGTYNFTIQADNHVGIYDATVPVTISPATLGSPAPAVSGRRVNASICSSPPKGRKSMPVCDRRTVIGTLLPLAANATAVLERGTVTYAVGRAAARYRKLTLHLRRRMPAGKYTLTLRRGHHALIVPVTITAAAPPPRFTG